MANKNEIEYREISYIEESSREGLLFKAWTGTWGLKIYTWYSMDKIKFSFIEKGKSGKGNSFDVCVNAIKDCAMDFETLAHEVLQNIRTPYSFTGNKGEKSVGICNSQSGGFCINGSSVVNGKPVHANVPVSYYDIYAIVDRYNRTYEKRRSELLDILTSGIEEKERIIAESHQKAEEEGQTAETQQPMLDETSATETAKPESIAPVKEPAKAIKKATTKADNTKVANSIHVRTVSDIQQSSSGGYEFKAVKDNDDIISVTVPKEVADQLNSDKANLFTKFVNKANKDGADFSFTGKKKRTSTGVEYVFAAFA